MSDELFEVRITRYADKESFDQVVDLVTAVFPERSRDDLAAGLAVTPVLLSGQASRAAAESLKDALGGVGATVLVKAVQGDDSSSDSLEVRGEFLGSSGRERPVRPSRDESSNPSSDKPPWEQS